MTVFGQLVIGAPGAGKSTYCEGMRQYMGALGRDVAVVNLDPANDEPLREMARASTDLARRLDLPYAAQKLRKELERAFDL